MRLATLTADYRTYPGSSSFPDDRRDACPTKKSPPMRLGVPIAGGAETKALSAIITKNIYKPQQKVWPQGYKPPARDTLKSVDNE
jgi:hypothetical protein